MKITSMLTAKAGSKGVKLAIVAIAAVGGISVVSQSVFAGLTATAYNTTAQSVTSGTLSLTSSNQATNTNGFSSSFAVSNMAPGDTVNRYINLTNGGTLAGQSMTVQLGDTGTISNTVTAASAAAGTVTYTYTPADSTKYFKAGEIVTITGLSTAAFNLSAVTIATANATTFTVTNAATGTAVTGASATATVPDRLTSDATNGLQFTLSNCSTDWLADGTCTGSTTILASTAASTLKSSAQTLTAANLNLASLGVNHVKISMALPAGSESVVNGVYPSGTVQGETALLTLTWIEALRTNTTTNS